MTDYEKVKSDAIQAIVPTVVSLLAVLRDVLAEALKAAKRENGW